MNMRNINLLFLFFLIFVRISFAQIISTDVAKIISAFQQLDYQTAKIEAERVVLDWQKYTINELVEVHKILGIIAYTDGDLNEANKQFKNALSLNNSAQLDSVLTSPKILLMDEPTRGIDVGAKAEVFQIMGELAAQGMGVIFVTSELKEILAISDRVIVMSKGRITGEFGREEATEEALVSASAIGHGIATA